MRIWDAKTATLLKTFEGHTGRVTALAFSENGYYLASCAEDDTVRLWNLTTLSCIRTLPMPEGHQTSIVTFDKSGSYLAIGGTDVRVYTAKKGTLLATLTDHTCSISGLAWGPDATFLAAASVDSTVKVFGPVSSSA